MYNNLCRFTLLLGFLSTLVLGATIVKKDPNKEPWGLMEAMSATKMLRGFNGTWITDNELYYTAADRSIHTYNAANQTDQVFAHDDFFQKYLDGTFTLSPENDKILVRFELEQVFRHSYIAKYDVYDTETKIISHVHEGKKLQHCVWSPKKARLSFVYENNVYVRFENDVEAQITTEGITGEIYNGVPDWVYEEEVLSSASAMWWSPDGNMLAIGFFNDTEVQTFKYTLYGDNQYPQEMDLKYPKAGTPNPVVAVKVFDFSNSKFDAPSIIEAPTKIVSKDHILQNVEWSGNNETLITWLNRRQNVASIQLCSTQGKCKEITRIEEPKGWISIGKPLCLKNGRNCLFTYWIGNWYQIWNLDLETGKNIWESRGDFTVTALYGYDEVNKNIYYQATLPGDPSQHHVFRDDKCLSCEIIDEDGDKCRQASASFSKGYTYYALVCSGPNPAYANLYDTKTNTKIITWQDNSEFRKMLEGKLRPQVKFLNVTLGDGFTGYAKLYLPPGLNWDRPILNKKHPMIVNVYGGPNSVRVTNSFTVGLEGYMTTNKDVVYAIIDGRGTGNKGKDLLFSVNNNLGEHEVEDQIAVAEYLQKNLKFVSNNRTAMWGWSYGGYMTAKTIEADDNNVFQCGISVAPVTSWIYYDTIYTERFMGLPTENDNLRNYKLSDAFEHLDNFRTHEFLLIHGSGDDNVHYQQGLMLAKVLQHNDILFSQMTYPDEDHSIGNYSPHLYHTIDTFFTNCLDLKG
ncbi:venom dipeptidyl peptidase 4 [Episyrphus balteatus]|uniref:venom dipeptidyl peptidase 4 n=1 Tax=Episyrphus balteatus TaxID=286459 RepID=UPI002484FFE0|nr:venom dipeptidyl peptidase 4 [Episyrphus balteatus]XP_055852603.1 venom dipeptidyl peptidase 4 [Episyrphus balteatus]